MINKNINISDIKFNYVEYDLDLYESIKNIKVVIPIKVKIYEDRYLCIDGNKRLSVLKDLSLIDAKYKKVLAMIVNDFSKSGSGYWGNTRNTH